MWPSWLLLRRCQLVFPLKKPKYLCAQVVSVLLIFVESEVGPSVGGVNGSSLASLFWHLSPSLSSCCDRLCGSGLRVVIVVRTIDVEALMEVSHSVPYNTRRRLIPVWRCVPRTEYGYDDALPGKYIRWKTLASNIEKIMRGCQGHARYFSFFLFKKKIPIFCPFLEEGAWGHHSASKPRREEGFCLKNPGSPVGVPNRIFFQTRLPSAVSTFLLCSAPTFALYPILLSLRCKNTSIFRLKKRSNYCCKCWIEIFPFLGNRFSRRQETSEEKEPYFRPRQTEAKISRKRRKGHFRAARNEGKRRREEMKREEKKW